MNMMRDLSLQRKRKPKMMFGIWLLSSLLLGIAFSLSIGSITVGMPMGLSAGILLGIVAESLLGWRPR